MSINFFSLTTIPVTILMQDDRELGKATAFFYKSHDDRVFLITNWHVVTGRNPENSEVSINGAVPYKLKCHVHIKQGDKKEINLKGIGHFTIQINNKDGTKPIWKEHPEYKHQVDLVAIELDDFKMIDDAFVVNIINDYRDFRQDYKPSVMDTVFVIGYPWGLSGGSDALPIFKRGSISTEPAVNQNGLPKMLIDCRTSSSMSGSPVLVSHSGVWSPNGKLDGNTHIGTLIKFLGVYSGRMNSQESQEISEIGIVWKHEALEAVVNCGVEGFKLNA